MTKIAPVTPSWDGSERRKPNSCRRHGERRVLRERRCDIRDQPRQRHRDWYQWLRSLVKVRLGVDRRKNEDRRLLPDRRRINTRALLSKEELADLLR